MPDSGSASSRTQMVLAAISIAILLSLAWPGVRAARADEPAQPVEADASYDGFVQSVSNGDRAGRVVETVGPSCGDGSDVTAEMQQQRAMALVRARMMAEMRAREASGEQPDVVMLNNRGYNYRALEEGAAPTPAGASKSEPAP